MASKSEIMNPNPLISVEEDDHVTMEALAKLYYDEEMTPDELDDKISEMSFIVMIFKQLGLSFDVKKIKSIVANSITQREEADIIINRFMRGELSYLIPPRTVPVEFLVDTLNRMTTKKFNKFRKDSW